jgi:hypothetical protein
LLVDVDDEARHVLFLFEIHAGHRFVEQKKVRLHCQCAAELHALLQAVRQAADRNFADGGDLEKIDDLLDPAPMLDLFPQRRAVTQKLPEKAAAHLQRAARQNVVVPPISTLSVGISLEQIWVIVWFAAGVVALATGIMWGARSEVSLSLQIIALKALPVLILGGLTSIPGAIVGGLIIGIGDARSDRAQSAHRLYRASLARHRRLHGGGRASIISVGRRTTFHLDPAALKNGQAAHQYQATWRCRVSQPPTDSLQPFSKGRRPRLYSLRPSHDEHKSSQAQLNLRALS